MRILIIFAILISCCIAKNILITIENNSDLSKLLWAIERNPHLGNTTVYFSKTGVKLALKGSRAENTINSLSKWWNVTFLCNDFDLYSMMRSSQHLIYPVSSVIGIDTSNYIIV